jgi:hypothetical protein
MSDSLQRLTAALVAASLSTIFAADRASGQDSAQPMPKVYNEGPSLKFDFPQMRIGTAEYDEGPTGTTVFVERITGVQAVAGTWQVTLDVGAHKMMYDSAGVETELPMNELLDIGVFGSPEKERG